MFGSDKGDHLPSFQASNALVVFDHSFLGFEKDVTTQLRTQPPEVEHQRRKRLSSPSPRPVATIGVAESIFGGNG